MKTPVWALLICALLLFFWFCAQPEKNAGKSTSLLPPLKTRPVHFSKDSAEAFDRFHQAEIYAYLYKNDSALLLSEDCVKRFENLLHYTRDTLTWIYFIDSYFNVGYIYQLKQENDSAFKYLNISLDWCRKILGEDHLIATKCLIKLGNCYGNYGEMNKAKEYYLKAYEIRVRTMDSLNTFLVNINSVMAYFYWDMGDVDHAEIFASRSQSLIKRLYDHFILQNPELPDAKFYDRFMGTNSRPPVVRNLLLGNVPRMYISSTLNLALRFLNNDEPEKASYFAGILDSLIIKHEPGNLYFKLAILEVKAAIHLYNKEWSKAEELMAESEETETGAAAVNLPIVRYRLADYYHKVMKYDECIRVINRTLYPSGKISPYDEFGLLELKGRALLMGKKQEDCIQFCEEILTDRLNFQPYRILQDSGFQWGKYTSIEILRIQDFLKPLIRSHFARGKSSEDLEELKLAYRLLQIFHASMIQLQEQLYSRQSKTNRHQFLYPFYEDALHLCLLLFEKTNEEKYAMEVFFLSDLVKAFQIKEVLDKQNMSMAGQEGRQRQSAEQLQLDIAFVRDQILEMERISPLRDSLRLFNLKKTQAELAGQLLLHADQDTAQSSRIRNPYDYTRFPLEPLRAYLEKENADLLDYFVGTNHLYILLLNKNGFKIIKKERDPSWEEMAANFSASLKKKDQLFDDDSLALWSSNLFEILVRPVADRISGNRWIIIPDNWLAQIPFECLRREGHLDSPNLIATHTIRYEYASTMPLKSKAATYTTLNYAGFAPSYGDHEVILQRGLDSVITYPVYDANREAFGSLLFNESEVRESATLWKGEGYTGKEVDKSLFLKNGANARILHLAMHALADDKHPEYSQLIFKNTVLSETNEALYTYELARVKLNAELSVLSACNTGSGKYQKGEGVLSLGRAFKAAGCPNIVMSLWPANDASTKDIVVGFFRELKNGMGKADALRKAKKDYLNSAAPELRHPYYWAGLVLIGDNEPVLMEDKHAWAFVLAVILSIVALFVYFVKRPSSIG